MVWRRWFGGGVRVGGLGWTLRGEEVSCILIGERVCGITERYGDGR
jgi:hypothetical protein